MAEVKNIKQLNKEISKGFKKKGQSTQGVEFGKYQEANGGGGSPQAYSGRDENNKGVNSDYREKNNDTKQPRTKDGKFTYKSANGNHINPKYGPSRGKTVNPLLTGGINGIKISDVETQFENKQGEYWDKYKDSWYTKGSEAAMYDKTKTHSGQFKTRVAGEAIWNVAKELDKISGEFSYKRTKESDVFGTSKKGARSLEEQKAIAKAAKYGKSQFVTDTKTGGIKNINKFKKKTSQPVQQSKQTNVQNTTPVTQTQKTTPVTKNTQTTTTTPVQTTSQSVQQSKPVVSTPKQPLKDFSSDSSLAKQNPMQFVNTYRNEINEMLNVIHTKKPGFSTKQLVKMIGDGKIKSVDAVKKVFSAN